MVDNETLKTAKEVAKLHKTINKSALELMLNDSLGAIKKLKQENDSLKSDLMNPRPDKRVEALEKDLAIVFEELEKLKEYSLSHLDRYCRLVAEKGAEEQPRLSPEQHDQALSRIKGKSSGSASFLSDDRHSGSLLKEAVEKAAGNNQHDHDLICISSDQI